VAFSLHHLTHWSNLDH